MKKTLLPILVVLAAFVGCSKEKEVKDERDPTTYHLKADFGTYSMVRGIEEADSKNTFYAVPGFHYDFGIVKSVITETAIEFHRVGAPDETPEMASLVAAYPITKHFDIVKKKNDFGEETNILEEEQKRPWNERAYIRVDWANPVNTKAAVTNQLWAFGVLSEEKTTLLEAPKVDADGTLHFTTESQVKESGAEYFDEYSYEIVTPSYRVRTKTFFVPYKKTDYAIREMNNSQFAKFGYFRTFENFLDPDRGPMDNTVKHYANMFNVCEGGRQASCSTNKIVYHLTEGIPAEYMEATEASVKSWNRVFQKALNRSDDVIVLNKDSFASIADPRLNVIAYYNGKTEAGLLGVSQTRVDSTTGETFNARSTVYGDGIRYTQAKIDDYIDDLANSPSGIPGCTTVSTFSRTKITPELILGNQKTAKSSMPASGTFQRQSIPTKIEAVAKEAVEKNKGNVEQAFQRRNQLWEKARGNLTPIDMNVVKKYDDRMPAHLKSNAVIEDMMLNKQSPARKKAKMMELKLAALGIHGAELVDEATKHYVEKFASENTSLCNDVEAFKRAIRVDVAKLTYYTTLLHEMGHNFGLRHNFHASAETEDHFHPQYKVIKNALTSGNNPEGYKELDLDFYAYSSVMDYSAAFYEVQGGLGPYDGAAIKFGYNRSIDVEQDDIVKEGFRFCTDHEVGEQTLCSRHDKGQNLAMATLNNIERFNRGYVKSHFRRGRHNFEDSFWGVIYSTWMRILIPTRQVMDEFVYQMIMSPPAQFNNLGCTSEFQRASIAAGEFANICNPAAAEDAGVNILDWNTLPLGLFTKESLAAGKPVFRKDPKTYIPNGLADLVFANMLARDFFKAIVGSPEADTYLMEGAQNAEKLTALPAGPSDEDRLAALAMERGEANIQAFINANKPNLVRIGLGPITAATPQTNYRINPVGSWFMSKVNFDGNVEQLENVGFIWDKYLAIMTLGMRYIGVEKYARASMMGNSYLWPQGAMWSTEIIDAMATEKPYLAQSYVTTIGNKTALASVPASSDINLRSIAIMVGIADFATDIDGSFVDKLRICNSTDAMKCTPSSGKPAIQFETASGTDFFKAGQNFKEDSIAYTLVSAGKAIADQRKEYMKQVTQAAQLWQSAKDKLNAGNNKRAALDVVFKSEPQWASLSGTVTSNVGTMSQWQKSKALIDGLDKIGLFKTLAGRDEAINDIVAALTKVRQSTVSQAKKDAAELQILDYVTIFIQISDTGQPGALDDAANVKIAPEMVRITTEDLGREEAMINLTRKFMKWLALD